MTKAILFSLAGVGGLWFWSWIIGTDPYGWWVFPAVYTAVFQIVGCFTVAAWLFIKKFCLK